VTASPRLPLRYHQVDVFAARPFAGNGLAVFSDARGLEASQMQQLARELNQFESSFLEIEAATRVVRARIFTVEEELPFAGHPVLGAAAVAHLETCPDEPRVRWTFVLGERRVPVESERRPHGFIARMDQGPTTFGPPLDPTTAAPFLGALGLSESDRHPRLPLQMVSTGLPYLIVPVHSRFHEAGIRVPGFEALLATVGAKFVYVLDPDAPEGRTWDNAGLVEDVATGSAAGPTGAYLVHHGLLEAGAVIPVHQGARAGRPSELRVTVRREAETLYATVEGDVVPVAQGAFARLPGD
jgi:trans-2,3-dihydro-3-hydroxyanthranilate isomerase